MYLKKCYYQRPSIYKLVNLLSTKSVEKLFNPGKFLCNASLRGNSAVMDWILAYHCLHNFQNYMWCVYCLVVLTLYIFYISDKPVDLKGEKFTVLPSGPHLLKPRP